MTYIYLYMYILYSPEGSAIPPPKRECQETPAVPSRQVILSQREVTDQVYRRIRLNLIKHLTKSPRSYRYVKFNPCYEFIKF